jgi:hypothetical protein
MTTPCERRLLYRLAKEVTVGCIVEIGSYQGHSTVALARGAAAGSDAPVYAIEPHERFDGVLGGTFGPQDRAAFYRRMLRTSCYKSVRLINLKSHIAVSGWEEPVGLLWIDGDHRYEAVKQDFESWRPHLISTGIVVFHDSVDTRLGPCRLLKEIQADRDFRICGCIDATTWIEPCES